MNEKTPFIVLTVVFVVGFVGLVMMMTESKTGAYNVYDSPYAQDQVKRWQIVSGSRNLYGGAVIQSEQQATIMKETGVTIEGGQAYTQEGQATGNLGISGTVQQDTTKRSKFRQPVTNEQGCYVYGVPKRSGELGLQYAFDENSQGRTRLLDCYQIGDTTPEGNPVMVRAAMSNRNLIWGAENTRCCFQTALTSTY